MKTCRNCRYLWPDDYVGQCQQCGAGMGGIEEVNYQQDLARRWAQQNRKAQAEANNSDPAKGLAGDAIDKAYERIPVEQSTIEVAKRMLLRKDQDE